MGKLGHQDIETLAFFIWEKQGRPHGRAMEHWLEAEYLIHTQTFTHESPTDCQPAWDKDQSACLVPTAVG
jgi:hypothetical protein